MFPPEELAILRSNATAMIEALDQACYRSSDPPDLSPMAISHRPHTGRRGRPRVEIDSAFLAYALQLRGPTHLSDVVHCSSRTIRRRAIEQGIAQPAAPVRQEQQNPDGSITVVHTSTTRPKRPSTHPTAPSEH